MAARPDPENPEETETKLQLTLRFLKIYWKIVFALVWAIILVPFVFIYTDPQVRCAYTILVMAGYWITECFPMAVTSLIPLVLFPMLGVLSTAETCSCYMNDTIMVFIGGLVLALAIEHSNLHLRIALGVMKVVGCSHAKLLGGVCAVTTFISMWVSNTAATAMMVPIIYAILNELEQAGLCRVFDTIVDQERPGQEPDIKPTNLTKAYLMAAAYCSTFGGTGTLVGTGTNLTFKGIFENTFPDAEGINFTQWMIANVPQMVMQARYKELGGISFHESGVAALFGFCIILWLLRKPGFVTGWSEAITTIDIRDSTPVILVSILMFFIPKDPSFIRSFSKDPAERPHLSSDGLITWKVIESKMPWSLMFLLGGGFAISKGSIASTLAKTIGGSLVPLGALPPPLILILVSFFIGCITEFTSNVGIANITLPVVAQMSVAMKIHPMYLMIPTTIMCSYSFRLPVGTPPNAIIATMGRISTKYLIMGGCGPAVYALIVQSICFLTWGSWIYGAYDFPEWAKGSDDTSANE